MNAIKAYGRVEVRLNLLLTLILIGGELSGYPRRFNTFLPSWGKNPWYQLSTRLDGSQDSFEPFCRNISCTCLEPIPRFLARPHSSPVAIRTTLLRLQFFYSTVKYGVTGNSVCYGILPTQRLYRQCYKCSTYQSLYFQILQNS